MSDYPLVSVVIPSFNHAQYISVAIESVISQTYTNWELFVVDDGSSDNTAEVLLRYKDTPKINIIINKKNNGQSAVINQALALAKGEFICFLPSDDWYEKNKLKSQVEKFAVSGPRVGVIYGRGARYYESTGETVEPRLKFFRGDVLRHLIENGNFVYPITPLFRRDCFKKVRFNETYRAEGEAIYLKVAMHYEFDYVDEVVGVMRDHGYNTGKDVEMMYIDNLRYWTEFFQQEGLPVDILKLRDSRIAKLKRLKGIELVALRSNFSAGRSALIEAIQLNPRLLFDFRVVGAVLISMLPKGFSKAIIRKIKD